MELQVGSVVRSRAGHDTGQYFAVVDMQDGYVLISDGRQRPVEKPKRKKLRHIAVTNTKLSSDLLCSNSGLRKALKQFTDNSTTSLQGRQKNV